MKVIYRNSFSRDLKRANKHGKDIHKLKRVLRLLSGQECLPQAYREHLLIGQYAKRRECHIEPDWLLIYKLEKDVIIFERTGSHSDLFKK